MTEDDMEGITFVGAFRAGEISFRFVRGRGR